MRIQLLSDLHFEWVPRAGSPARPAPHAGSASPAAPDLLAAQSFTPQPAPGADLLVLAGDIDSTWRGYERFAGWPVPVVVVAGNHEFDGRDLDQAWPALAAHCAALGLSLVERATWRWRAPDGTRLRLLATVRWSDFDVFGAAGRPRAMRAAGYYARLMRARRGEAPFDAAAVREEALACRDWLAQALAEPAPAGERTVVVTHYAPSLHSLDPRYGRQPTTASFCNADEALMPGVDLWLHGHVHRRHDYRIAHADGRSTRVVAHPRGIAAKGECAGYDALRVIEV